MSENDNRSQMHKSQWRLRQVTDELNARPFPRFALPTAIFRLCLSGEEAFDGLRDALRDTLSDIDWDADAQRRLSAHAKTGCSSILSVIPNLSR